MAHATTNALIAAEVLIFGSCCSTREKTVKGTNLPTAGLHP